MVYAPAVFWRALLLLALLCLSQPIAGAVAAKRASRSAPTPVPPAPKPDVASIAMEVRRLKAAIDELRDSLHQAEVPPGAAEPHRTDEILESPHRTEVAPPWAEAAHEQVLQRLERLQTLQERLAARIETPVPRLDEPIVLLTVGGATLVLGFVAGRAVQRRSSRRDRFRL